ncbi:hypothetical protein PIB30_107143, partial [Stylosanthes scabra]|nr:hypothetical protein [Stylosanthes scabra]
VKSRNNLALSIGHDVLKVGMLHGWCSPSFSSSSPATVKRTEAATARFKCDVGQNCGGWRKHDGYDGGVSTFFELPLSPKLSLSFPDPLSLRHTYTSTSSVSIFLLSGDSSGGEGGGCRRRPLLPSLSSIR